MSHTGSGEDVFGETYGPDSICLQQGRTWEKVIIRDNGVRSTLSVGTYGGGCYEVYIIQLFGGVECDLVFCKEHYYRCTKTSLLS